MYTVTRLQIDSLVMSVAGVAMANYLHVPLDSATLLRFGTTAAARGITIKVAAAEAVSAWVHAHSDAVRAVADGRAPTTKAVLRQPPPTPVPIVVDAAAKPILAPPAQSPTGEPGGAWPSADEILRESGHQDYQSGIVLQASALIRGAAAVTAAAQDPAGRR